MSRDPNVTSRHLFRRWKELAVPASWLLVTFGAVLAFPVRISSSTQGPHVVVGLVGVIICAVVGWLRVQRRRPIAKRGAMGVRLLAYLLLFVAAWILYSWLKEYWTCPYTAATRLVVADTPTTDLLAYLKERGDDTASFDCQWVKEYAGDTERMFRFQDLALRYYLLVLLYIGSWLALMGVVWTSVRLAAWGPPATRKRKAP